MDGSIAMLGGRQAFYGQRAAVDGLTGTRPTVTMSIRTVLIEGADCSPTVLRSNVKLCLRVVDRFGTRADVWQRLGGGSAGLGSPLGIGPEKMC